MGTLTNAISGNLVAFDTAPLIYYIEEHPDYLSIVDELFGAFDAGDASGITSVLTMHEVLVKPLRDGRRDIADRYREVLTNSVNVTLHAIDLAICGIAASFRAKYQWLRAPDALQIGTAIGFGASIIVTNDQRFSKVTEVGVVVLRDLI